MHLDDYQRRAAATDQRPEDEGDAIVYSLLQLTNKVGGLSASYHRHRYEDLLTREWLVDEVHEGLGDALWHLAMLARTLDVSLEEVAARNLSKTGELWATQSAQLRLLPAVDFDEGSPETERLPKKFSVFFETSEADGLSRTQMKLISLDDRNDTDPEVGQVLEAGGEERGFPIGAEIGDSLDDNSYDEDYYRFHDAFHLAGVAVLGWSPVFRSLFKRKRKSKPDVDRVEDGARARDIEEALSVFVFSRARSMNYFADAKRVDWELLKMARQFTFGLEVSERSEGHWQKMILSTFDVWRSLKDNDGGIVEVDREGESLRFNKA